MFCNDYNILRYHSSHQSKNKLVQQNKCSEILPFFTKTFRLNNDLLTNYYIESLPDIRFILPKRALKKQ